MSHLFRAATYLILVVTLAACGASGPNGDEPGGDGPGGDGPPTTDPAPIAGNNAGIVRGVPLGTGVASTSELRRTVPVSVISPHPDLEVSTTATITRRTTGSEAIYGIVPVSNVGDVPLCFVQFEDLAYLDAGGTILTDFGDDYVAGSVGRMSNDIYTDTCLDEGETGHVLTIETTPTGDLYSVVAELEIGAVSASTLSGGDHDARLVPTGGDAYDATGGRGLDVVGTNQGTMPLDVSSDDVTSSTYVLLDSNEEPVTWGFLDAPTLDLEPGGSATWTDTLAYEGSGNAVRVRFAFEPAGVGTGAALALCDRDAGTMTQEELHDARVRAIDAQRLGISSAALCADRDRRP